MRTRIVFGALAGAVLLAPLSLLAADKYPSKPIRMIVPYNAGGNGDISARYVADRAGELMGTTFVVENKVGGGAYIGTNQCAKADPDGYTVCFTSTSPIVIRPHLAPPPYDPLKDLTYLGQYGVANQPIIVRADGKYNSLKDLIDHARKNPGALRWSAAVVRGGPHLATEAMFQQEGVKATFLPSKGGAVELTNLLSGTIDMAVIADYGTALDAGTIKIIGETTPNRNPSAPEVKTLKELGYPLAPAIFIGLAAPAGLPKEVVAKWDEVLTKITASDGFKQLMERIKSTPAHLNSAQLTEQVKVDYVAMGKAIASLGIKE